MPLNSNVVRAQFPALQRPVIFLDNPGGTQIARTSLEQIQRYLVEANANHGGAFATSRDSDQRVENARLAMADFLNAARPEEIVFGPNMTSLTFNISRALARTFQPGDILVVTRLDHDANISPWLLAAEDRGCRIRWVDFHPEDCTLDLEDLKAALDEKPCLVAVGYASNAVGTVNPVKEITRLAHAAGALVYIDAVQYAPHGPIDVRDLDCDFLVCSAYKFFGPHLGVLYGRYELLDRLPAYRVRPAPAEPPGKFETGTGNFENYCGLLGALEYFEWLGETFGHAERQAGLFEGRYSGRALTFKKALRSLAVPPLGCGQGQLEWKIVGPTLYRYSIELDIPVELYAPYGTPHEELRPEFLEQGTSVSSTELGLAPERVKPAWVALVEILSRLEQEPYHWPVGRTTFQKIVYVATQEGLPTGLHYQKSSFGPFSPELKGVITRLVNNGLIREGQLGRMFSVKVGSTFADARKAYKNELARWESIIEKTTDLFMRMQTRQSEVVATVLFAANMVVNRKKEQPSEKEVLNEVMEWKQRRRPKLDDKEVAYTIRNLAALSWLKVKPSPDLAISDEIITEA